MQEIFIFDFSNYIENTMTNILITSTGGGGIFFVGIIKYDLKNNCILIYIALDVGALWTCFEPS